MCHGQFSRYVVSRRIFCAQVPCLHAGDLVLQQVAASVFSNVAEATPKDLANICKGLSEIQMLGYRLTDDQLQHILDRSQQLSSQSRTR